MSRPRDWSPLADQDPVPGDPDEVARLAARYAATAGAIRTAVDNLRRIHDSPSDWSSPAGSAFRERLGDTATSISAAYQRYQRTGEALAGYAPELRSAQDIADRALRTAQQAAHEAAQAQQNVDHANAQNPPDTAQAHAHGIRLDQANGTIEDARRQLDRAREDWHQAGRRAAARIEDVSAHDGLKDSLWDDFLGVMQQIADIAGKLSAILGIVATICAFVPFLQPFAALFATLALIVGVIALVADSTLYASGKGSLSDVLWDIAGVISFGGGRAFTMTARTLLRGARGLAKPALIGALRAGGASARQASRIARARGVTGGGRLAKAAMGQASSPFGWLPRGSTLANAFNPVAATRDAVRDIRAGADLLQGGVDAARSAVRAMHSSAQGLPQVQAAVRRATVAAGVSTGMGVLGNLGDLKGAPVPWPHNTPFVGQPVSPVNR